MMAWHSQLLGHSASNAPDQHVLHYQAFCLPVRQFGEGVLHMQPSYHVVLHVLRPCVIRE